MKINTEHQLLMFHTKMSYVSLCMIVKCLIVYCKMGAIKHCTEDSEVILNYMVLSEGNCKHAPQCTKYTTH